MDKINNRNKIANINLELNIIVTNKCVVNESWIRISYT